MVTVENHIGKISVTENYLTEIVRHAVCDCFGVADVCNVNTFRSAVSSITRGKLFKPRGVKIRTDKDGGLVIDLHIKVTYGTNIAAAVNSITHKVTFTVEEAVGIDVHKVNVFVDDMNY
ncbi:MAG: Asp23/Gls24 family envelope stress response protein [Ruminococcus sp.]|nr:Asp23/Gls24 family envelope stress response protein [Ruminococcus sp.]